MSASKPDEKNGDASSPNVEGQPISSFTTPAFPAPPPPVRVPPPTRLQRDGPVLPTSKNVSAQPMVEKQNSVENLSASAPLLPSLQPNIKDGEGGAESLNPGSAGQTTPLLLALEDGDMSVVRRLANISTVRDRDMYGRGCLHIAVQSDNVTATQVS